MNDDISIVRRELDRGEQVLWQGRPTPTNAASGSWGGAVAGPIIIIFALFWMGGASSAGAPPIFTAFGLIFVFAGVAAFAAPFRSMDAAANTVYAITDRRILVIEDGTTQKVQSYTATDIERIERRETGDGRGDVIFARERYSRHHDGHTHHHEREIGLWGVENAREVERLLRENFKRD